MRDWKSNLIYYERVVGIRVGRNILNQLTRALWKGELRGCPREVIYDTLVVPEEAVRFFSLGAIKHELIKLRHAGYLDEKVQEELLRRFRKNDPKLPHYFETGKESLLTCVRYLVPLKTVQEIETILQK